MARKKYEGPFKSSANPLRKIPAPSRTVAVLYISGGAAALEVGTTTVILVTAVDAQGRTITPRPSLQWRSSDTSIVTITTQGVALAVGVGTATITASIGAISSGTFIITTSATPIPPPDPPPPPPSSVLTTVVVSPSSVPVGSPAFAVARDQVGLVLPSVVWDVSNQAIASVTSGGGVTGLSVGITDIRATSGGIRVNADVTVTAPVAPPTPVPVPAVTTVTLTPASILVAATATAVARDQFGTILSVGVTWSLGTPSRATVTTSGILTGVSAGTTTVIATHNAISVSATLTVNNSAPAPPVAPVLVRPANGITIAPSFIAELTFPAAGPTSASFELRTTGDVLVQAWPFTFANTLTSLTQTLQITSPVSGTYKVVGIVSAVTTTAATVTLSVPAPPPPTPQLLTTVVLSPFAILIGQTALALATDQNGQALTVTWTSSNLVLATVSNNGTVTGLSVGTVQITATFNSVMVSASLTVTAPVVPPVPGAKRLLSVTDLQYLGCMRVDANARMDFSYGQMTGRRVSGQVRLLMSGNVTQGNPIYEFADTGVYHVNPAQAPRMATVRNWGDIYGGKRITWDANGTERLGIPLSPGGLHWSEAHQLLYWTYYDSYNVIGIQDWSLGASQLLVGGPVAYGPWRASGAGRKGPRRCLFVGTHPQTGEMLCGSKLMSGNAQSPWGPDMWVGTFPTTGTPSGFAAADIPVVEYLTYYPIFGQVNINTGAWTGSLRSCRRPGDYFFEPTLTNTQIDPTKNGGVGTWTDLDYLQGFTWIDLPDVHGVVFTGKLAAAHVWYATSLNVPPYTCTHGMPAPVQVTGPVSTDAYPFLFVYDPADLHAVRTGAVVDWTVNPTQIINATSQWGAVSANIDLIGSARLFGEPYFDATTRTLYIAAPQADNTIPGYYLPLVHVFRIN